METLTNSNQSASVNAVDDIAALLIGNAEKEQPNSQPKKKQDSKAASTQPDESSAELEEEDLDVEEEPEEAEEIESEVDDSDLEVTWGKVLGLEEDKVVLNDEGDLTGIIVKVDGVTSTVAIPDLVAGYQINKNNTLKSQQLSAEKKQFEEDKSAVVSTYSKKIDEVGKLTSYLHQSILRDYQGIDWDTLRTTNPGEYAASVQDYNMRIAEIGKINEAISAEQNAQNEVAAREYQNNLKNYVSAQAEKVLEKNPDWVKPEVFKSAMDEMSSVLETEYGFSKEDFYQIQDARIFEVLKDAIKYKKGKSIAENKVAKPIPKFQKPGTKQVKKVSKVEQLIKKAQNAKPGVEKKTLQDSAIAAILLGG